MNEPVKCPRCRRRMTPGGTCNPERGVLRWGENVEMHSGLIITWNCHDCGAAPGAWHHAGCLLRYDARTGEQL